MTDAEDLDGRFALEPGPGPWRLGADRRTGRPCRARAVPAPAAGSAAARELGELAASLLKVRHPSLENLLALRDSKDGKSVWWIYEAAEGKTFAELAAEKRPFGEREAAGIAAALAGALRAARKAAPGLPPLGLAPDRLLLTPAGRPVILAPGPFARDEEGARWRAPAGGDAGRADLYAAGASLAYLFSGRGPEDFEGEDGYAGIGRYAGFSPEFCAVLGKMAPRKGSPGYGSARELERELELQLAGRGPSRLRGGLRLLLLAACAAAAWSGVDRLYSRGGVATLRGGEVEWAMPGGLAFSPDGDSLALAGGRELLVWDTRSWKPSRLSEPEGSTIRRYRSAAYFPDGRLAVLLYGGRGLKVYDAARKPLCDYLLAAEPDSLAISPDGSLLAVAVNSVDGPERRPLNGRVLLFEGRTLRPLVPLNGQGGPVHALQFEPDGRALVYRTLYRDEAAKDWNLGRVVRRPVDGGQEEVLFADPEPGFRLGLFALGPGGMLALPRPSTEGLVVVGRGDRLLATLNADSALEKYFYTTSSEGAFSPDGKLFAASLIRGGRARLRLYRTDGWKLLREFRLGRWRDGPVAAVAFSPDGRLVAAAQDDGGRSLVRVFSTTEAK